MTDQAKTSADAAVRGGAAGKSAVDEFAHIRSPRTRHPVLAAAAAALAFFLVFHIRADLRYALSSAQPLDLGDARVTFAPTAQPPTDIANRLVRVRGTPDRESALELDTKGSWVFSQLFRLLGTGDRLFVHRRESPLPAARAEQDVFEGRLIRFADLSFEDSIRGYFTQHVTATHFFAPAALAQGLAGKPGGPLQLKDRAGDAVTVAPGDELALDVVRPDEVRVGLGRLRFATEAEARAAIEKQGGQIVSTVGIVKTDVPGAAPSVGPLSLAGNAPPIERWTFVARFPSGQRDAALGALEDLDPKIAIRDARETLRAPLERIRADGGAALVVEAQPGQPRRLPLDAVAAARTVAGVQIPADAYLVIEADTPREHMASVLIAMLLVMFGAINVVGLARELLR
jgi:hypothetical protein